MAGTIAGIVVIMRLGLTVRVDIVVAGIMGTWGMMV
jgi:hypothetical protein